MARVVVVTLPFLRIIVMIVVEIEVGLMRNEASVWIEGAGMYGVDGWETVKQNTR